MEKQTDMQMVFLYMTDGSVGRVVLTLKNGKMNQLGIFVLCKEETICHEMLHGMLVHLGFDELSQNEQLVQSLANAIYQGFMIRR